MRPSRWVHVAGLMLIGASLVTWYATGSEGYTRWPDARLAHADAPPAAGESELLADAGFTDTHAASPRTDIQSRFAFGLVPGGADPLHLISVATVTAAALVASCTVVVLQARCRSCKPRTLAPAIEGDRR